MTNSTALQVTNFNFYGDELIALKDNATDEISTQNGNQDTNCISIRKLPLALAKINITKRLERDCPHITAKLELYQNKCADVLASVFIDHKTTDQITMKPILDALFILPTAFHQSLASKLMVLLSCASTIQQFYKYYKNFITFYNPL